MSPYPPELRSHLTGTATSVCQCWALRLKDGATLGFTDHDAPLSFDGVAFRPETGLTASEARRTLGLASDSTDVEGALSSLAIAEADIASGRFDDAKVDVFLVNWREPSQRARTASMTIGRIARRDGRFWAELKGAAHGLDRPQGRFVARRCDAELGDARCRAALSAPGFNGAGVAVELDALGRIRASGLADFEPGWFAQGMLQWTTGALAGRQAPVRDHHRTPDGATFLVMETPQAASAGDAFTVRAGCDKSFATCKAKFANAANFRGFPHLPGNDAAYAYVSGEAVFDGAPLVA